METDVLNAQSYQNKINVFAWTNRNAFFFYFSHVFPKANLESNETSMMELFFGV